MTLQYAQLEWLARLGVVGFIWLIVMIVLQPPHGDILLYGLSLWSVSCGIGFFHATWLIGGYRKKYGSHEPDEKQDKS